MTTILQTIVTSRHSDYTDYMFDSTLVRLVDGKEVTEADFMQVRESMPTLLAPPHVVTTKLDIAGSREVVKTKITTEIF